MSEMKAADPLRAQALDLLAEIETKQQFSNLALRGREVSPFVRELVYGVLRRRMRLDYELDAHLKRPIAGMRPAERALLRMGLYQLRFMDGVPSYAALDQSVRLAKQRCPGKEGLVNAVLRACQRSGDPAWPADPAERLSVRHSCHPSIARLWMEQYGPEICEAMLAASSESAPLVLRPNRLKTDAAALQKALEEAGFAAERGTLCPEALRVKGSGILESRFFREGLCSVQGESSQKAVELLDPQPGDFLIDVCAAPGGKTMAAAERMGDRGRILACDLHAHKLKLIAREAERLGIGIVETRCRDAREEDAELLGQADRVLADVPCSGLGVLRGRPELRYKDYDKECAGLPALQSAILESASGYVKPGGTLLYSTCTISRAENEAVAEAFLESHPEFEVLQRLTLRPDLTDADGFFICKMRRKELCR